MKHSSQYKVARFAFLLSLVLVCMSLPSIARTILDNGQDTNELSQHILQQTNRTNTTNSTGTTNTTTNGTKPSTNTTTNTTNSTTNTTKTNGTTGANTTNGTSGGNKTNGTTGGNTTNTTNGTTGGNKTNGTTGGNTTNQTTPLTPARFNGTCFACVKNNYTYCPGDNVCRMNSTGCDRSVFDNTTGCPVRQECKIRGLDNILRLITNDGTAAVNLPVGYSNYTEQRVVNNTNSTKTNGTNATTNGTRPSNTTTNGTTNGTSVVNVTITEPVQTFINVSKDGNITFNISGQEPCYITLINAKQSALNWTVSGSNVSADLFMLDFPFNTSKRMNVSNFELKQEHDVVVLYIGSVNKNNQVANLKWAGPQVIIPVPPTPTPPTTDGILTKMTYLLSIIMISTMFLL